MAKNLTIFVLLGFLVLIAPRGWADDCSSVRLDAPGGSMANIPVQDQGDTGICYAEVASQWYNALLDRVLPPEKKPPKFLSSSLYASVNFSLDPKNKKFVCPSWNDKSLEYDPLFIAGFSCPALDALVEKGTCPDVDIDAFLSKWPKSKKLRDEAIDNARKSLANSIQRYESGKRALPNLDKKRRTKPDPYQNLYDMTKKELETLPREIEKSKEILKKIERMSPRSQLAALRGLYSDDQLLAMCKKECSACIDQSGSVTQGAPAVGALSAELTQLAEKTLLDFKKGLDENVCNKTTQNLLPKECKPNCQTLNVTNSLLHEQLSAPRALPLGVSVCSAVLVSNEQHEIWQDEKNISIPKNGVWKGNPKCGPHAVLLIGRQRNPKTGKCQFLIRNSWGAECSALGTCHTQSCTCEPGTGNSWIDEDLLVANTSHVSKISVKEGCK